MDAKQLYRHRLREGGQSGPLLFVFHGTGGDENQFFDFGQTILPEATVIAPRGDVSEHGAARFFRRTGEGVYDMDDLARATKRMTAFVEAYKQDHPQAQVIGLGFSNGANILANLMIEQAGLFDRAVLLHPLIPFAPAENPALSGRKVLITAGRRDPICPQPMTEALIDYFRRQGAAVTAEWHAGGHEIGQNEIEAVRHFLQ